MQGTMKQVIFREDQIPALHKIGKRLGVNRSVIVRWAVDEYLQKNLPDYSPEEISDNGERILDIHSSLAQPA
jgi:hypothetical protein